MMTRTNTRKSSDVAPTNPEGDGAWLASMALYVHACIGEVFVLVIPQRDPPMLVMLAGTGPPQSLIMLPWISCGYVCRVQLHAAGACRPVSVAGVLRGMFCVGAVVTRAGVMWRDVGREGWWCS